MMDDKQKWVKVLILILIFLFLYYKAFTTSTESFVQMGHIGTGQFKKKLVHDIKAALMQV